MFEVAIDPVLVTLGPLEIRYYGLVYALGFLAAYLFFKWAAKRQLIRFSTDEIDIFIIYAIVGGILGGRAGEFLFYQWDVLLSKPLELFRIWQGGMSIHGGFLGFLLATWLFCKKHNKRIYDITDLAVIPTAAALIFGRIANFINAELVGRVTSTSWCVKFIDAPNPTDRIGCRHPSQLYEALKNIIIFTVLTIKFHMKRFRERKPGELTWLFVLLYGFLRTVATIWRDDQQWFLGILSTGQVLSTIMALIAIVVLWKYYWCNNKTDKQERSV
ncbi:MAG: prolipoprotein diacylglyceryl transferase [Candidatus Woesearchaeota archaeon]